MNAVVLLDQHFQPKIVPANDSVVILDISGLSNRRSTRHLQYMGDAMEPVMSVRGIVVSADTDDRTVTMVFDLADEVSRAASRIVALAGNVPSRSAVQALAAVQALGLASTALLASIDSQCDLDQPPTSLDTRPRGPKHNLITRCQHDPPHCWEGTVFIDCP